MNKAKVKTKRKRLRSGGTATGIKRKKKNKKKGPKKKKKSSQSNSTSAASVARSDIPSDGSIQLDNEGTRSENIADSEEMLVDSCNYADGRTNRRVNEQNKDCQKTEEQPVVSPFDPRKDPRLKKRDKKDSVYKAGQAAPRAPEASVPQSAAQRANPLKRAHRAKKSSCGGGKKRRAAAAVATSTRSRTAPRASEAPVPYHCGFLPDA